jgi:type IV pilus assembly protein PilN
MRDFNFFLPYLDHKKERKNKKVYMITTLLILGAIIVGTFLYNTIYIFMLKADVKNLKNTFEMADNQEKLTIAESLNKKYSILNDYFKEVDTVFSDITERNIVNSNILYNISKSIPKEISFRTMSIDGNMVQIQGVSKSRVPIAELEHNLKAIYSIEEVHVGNINLEGNIPEGDYSFSIKCTLKGVCNDEAK